MQTEIKQMVELEASDGNGLGMRTWAVRIAWGRLGQNPRAAIVFATAGPSWGTPGTRPIRLHVDRGAPDRERLPSAAANLIRDTIGDMLA